MIAFAELKKIIFKFGLKPTSSRDMSLFSFTCVALGYTGLLRELIGFSYGAVAAFGEHDKWHSFFNELRVVEETGKFLEKHPDSFDKLVLAPARRIFKEQEKKFLQSENANDLERLKVIHDLYPRYMMCIGIYNCFWRYVGNDEHKKWLTQVDIKKISRERAIMAEFYPKVERVIKECSGGIGKTKGFDGDLLRYLTYFEMGRYLRGELSVDDMTQELSLRREKYFYLYIEKGNREEIVTDLEIVDKIMAEVDHVSTNISVINGFPVFKGVVQGQVYVMKNSDFDKSYPKGNFVLVASMTRPDDSYLVKKCVAIVTDEGGILSHAAIISREMKKPCIIGTKIATKVLKDGDMVEVDAEKGVVKILKKG